MLLELFFYIELLFWLTEQHQIEGMYESHEKGSCSGASFSSKQYELAALGLYYEAIFSLMACISIKESAFESFDAGRFTDYSSFC